MTSDELRQRIKDETESLAAMRFSLATGQLTNTSQLLLKRRDIARMNTVLTERLRTEGATA